MEIKRLWEQALDVGLGRMQFGHPAYRPVAAAVITALAIALTTFAANPALAHSTSVEIEAGSARLHEQAPLPFAMSGPAGQATDIGVVAYDDFVTTPRVLMDHADPSGAYIATRSNIEPGYMMGGRPTYTGLIVSYLRGRYDDAQVGITTRIYDGVAEGRQFMIGCREESANNQYRFVFLPAYRYGGGTYAVGVLEKWSQGVRTEMDARGIVHWSDGPLEEHRVSMKCDGNQIEGFVNGLLVASAVDDEFPTGRWWIGAKKNSNAPGQMVWILNDLRVMGKF